MNTCRYSISLGLIALLISSCGGGSAPEDAAPVVEEGPASFELVIRPVGDEMSYEQTEFTVEAGQEVTLVLENIATSPVMSHNIVLLSSDDDALANRVGLAGAAAVDTEYVPEDDAILAHTPLAAPGETVRVTFTAPSEPGVYRYICTFPGHFALMQGRMMVQ